MMGEFVIRDIETDDIRFAQNGFEIFVVIA